MAGTAKTKRSATNTSKRKVPTTSQFGKTDLHSAERLADQRNVQWHSERLKKASSINKKQRMLEEIAFYPKHAKRTETPAYQKIHKEMVVTKDLPCLVCGVKNSTLKNPKLNAYGAKQMETHHHVIEWALANAVDVGKFNTILRPNLAHRHPDNPVYSSAMTRQQILDWVDHSSDNLWVLCDVHHRAKYFGIHEITYPIWCPMDMLQQDFDAYVHEELKKAASSRPVKKAKNTRTAASKRRRGTA